MDEFFPSNWTWEENCNYGGIGLGSVDAVGEAYDVELDEILREYDDLSGGGRGQEQEQEEDNNDNEDVGVSPPKKRRTAMEEEEEEGQYQFLEEQDEAKGMVKGLVPLLQELCDELQIILFHYRKAYIRNLANTNYLRITPNPSFSDVISDLRIKIGYPYISARTDFGILAVPSATSQCIRGGKFPFTHERTQEWKIGQFNRLELCVYYSFYHKKIFEMDTRFFGMMSKMGFSNAEILILSSLRKKMDEEIWNAIKSDRLSKDLRRKAERISNLIHRHLNTERKTIEEIMRDHELKKEKGLLRPYVLAGGKFQTVIDLKHVIAWKQHEGSTFYKKIFNREGTINVDEVDWILVEKEMTIQTGRLESAEELKKIYTFNKSSKYNHAPMRRSELIKLKKSVQEHQDPRLGVCWLRIAELLGTGRSPIRVFQTYRNFIHKSSFESVFPFLDNDQNRLKAFMIMRRSLCYMPRTVSRLEMEFGSISWRKFSYAWQDLNPKFAIDEFSTVEDAALLLVLELFKEHLTDGAGVKKFSTLQTRLPWRSVETWRRRAGDLFLNKGDKWTFEEDQLILYAIAKFGLDWDGLEKIIPGRTKYHIVNRYRRVLETKMKHFTLTQYHRTYYRRTDRNNVGRLHLVLSTLDEVANEQQLRPDICADLDPVCEQDSQRHAWEYKWTPTSQESMPAVNTTGIASLFSLNLNGDTILEFLDLIMTQRCHMEAAAKEMKGKRMIHTSWKTPKEDEILAYIKGSFDPLLLHQTRDRLFCFIHTREMVRNCSKITKSKDLVLHYDRRKFFPTDPVSVANALYLRRVPLKSVTPEMWKNELTQFEKEVWSAYKTFGGGGSGYTCRASITRDMIPSALSLSFLPTIRNLLQNPRKLEESGTPNANIIKIEEEPQSQPDPLPVEEKENVEKVQATTTMVEAYNNLQRMAWNSTSQSKLKRQCYKTRRRQMNVAAAKSRWEKLREGTAATQVEEGSTTDPVPKMVREHQWYEALLKNSTQNYSGSLDQTKALKAIEEGNTEVKRACEFLTVLHDHAYCKEYVKTVETEVKEIRRNVMPMPEPEHPPQEENENSQIMIDLVMLPSPTTMPDNQQDNAAANESEEINNSLSTRPRRTRRKKILDIT